MQELSKLFARTIATLQELATTPGMKPALWAVLDDLIAENAIIQATKIVGGQYPLSVKIKIRPVFTAGEQEKRDARKLVQRAVAKGELFKPESCEGCKRYMLPQFLQGHHEDYSKPFDVKWLCPRCHGQEHTVHKVTVRRITRQSPFYEGPLAPAGKSPTSSV